MKLRNKKTGEIATLTLSTNGEDMIIMGNDMYAHITKLSELKDYEDYEEPKEYWYINFDLECIKTTDDDTETDGYHKLIGNYFETNEEAEKAVEKLKAWKRLKDKGFRFERWCFSNSEGKAKIIIKGNCVPDTVEELDLLFGGEEDA
ncbi:hypothetical protein IJH24_03530 [Candidatus Saccharibacteria bacterium]|nr:hypothetical protein [Candidatus Saccharibacteria bacterium]